VEIEIAHKPQVSQDARAKVHVYCHGMRTVRAHACPACGDVARGAPGEAPPVFESKACQESEQLPKVPNFPKVAFAIFPGDSPQNIAESVSGRDSISNTLRTHRSELQKYFAAF
jgi:hypothetical protein